MSQAQPQQTLPFVAFQRPYTCATARRVMAQIQDDVTIAHDLQPLISESSTAIERWCASTSKFGVVEQQQVLARIQSSSHGGRPIPFPDGTPPQIYPLAGAHEGVTPIAGLQSLVEWSGELPFSPHIRLTLAPRARLRFHGGTEHVDTRFDARAAFLAIQARNFEALIGRTPLLLGHAPNGGLLLSDQATPLDLLAIRNMSPARLPWIFRYLGPMQGRLQVANFGPNRDVPWASMVGMAWGLRPAKHVEVGIEHMYVLGGQGVPSLSAIDPLAEFFFLRPAGTSAVALNKADHRAGLNARFEFPQLAGMVLYGEYIFEDFGVETWYRNLWGLASYQVGLYFPRLQSQNTDLRIEAIRTSPFAYLHATFRDGYTRDRVFLGNSAGPAALTARATLGHEFSNDRGEISLHAARYSGNLFAWDERISTQIDNPDEYRAGVQGVWQHRPPNSAIDHRWTAGYEYGHQPSFSMGSAEHRVQIQWQIQWRP